MVVAKKYQQLVNTAKAGNGAGADQWWETTGAGNGAGANQWREL